MTTLGIQNPWKSNTKLFYDHGYCQDILQLIDPQEDVMKAALGEHEWRARMVDLNRTAAQQNFGLANDRAELKQSWVSMMNYFPAEDDDGNLVFLDSDVGSAHQQATICTTLFEQCCVLADPPLILATLAVKAKALLAMGSLEESLACADAAIMVLRPGNFDLVNIMKTTGMLPDIVDDPNWKQIVPGLRNPMGAFPGQRNYPSTLISYFRILLTAVRGSVLHELGRYDEALLSYEEGLWTVDHFLESDVSHSPKARVDQERSEFLVLIKKAKARGKSDQDLLDEIQNSRLYTGDSEAFIDEKESCMHDPNYSILDWWHDSMAHETTPIQKQNIKNQSSTRSTKSKMNGEGEYCNFCFKSSEKSLLICSACNSARYCSKTCQRQAWKQMGHKLTCAFIKKAIVTKEQNIDEAIECMNHAIETASLKTKHGKEKAQCLRRLTELLVEKNKNEIVDLKHDAYMLLIQPYRSSLYTDVLSATATALNRFGDLLIATKPGWSDDDLYSACSCYAEAVSMEPTNSQYHYSLGMSLNKLSECAMMTNLQEKSTKEFNFTMGLIFGERYEWRERVLAMETSKRVAIMVQPYKDYLTKAVDELREAFRLNPSNAMACYHLGRCVFKQGGDTPDLVNRRRALGIAKIEESIALAELTYLKEVVVEWKRVLAKCKTLPKHVGGTVNNTKKKKKKKKKKKNGR